MRKTLARLVASAVAAFTAAASTPAFVASWTHVANCLLGDWHRRRWKTKLYLNGKLAGTADGIREPFTWEPLLATIRLGVNYTGLFDELSMYTRALSDAEVEALSRLEGGVASLMK